jgi:hypothetical protein
MNERIALLIVFVCTQFCFGYSQSSTEITYFNVTPRTNGNLLKWATRYEYDNCMFEIYKTKDTATWQYVNTIHVGSDSNISRPYLYLDTEPFDSAYYMLVQVDCDGRFQRIVSGLVVNLCDIETYKIREPNVNCDSGLLLVSGEEICDVYVYFLNGQIRYTMRMKPYTSIHLNIYGSYIVEYLWVVEGDLKRSTYKVFCY